MSDKRTDIDRLLARGALSGAERDRILDAVADRVAAPRRRFHTRPVYVSFVGLMVAAVAIAIFVFPDRREDGFRAKGGVLDGDKPWIHLTCVGGRLESCPIGSDLAFRAAEGTPPGYLAAYAEPLAGGERIMYFSADSESPTLDLAAQPETVLRRGIRLGSEHVPGPYVVRIFLLDRPASAAELLANRAAVRSRAEIALTVTGR